MLKVLLIIVVVAVQLIVHVGLINLVQVRKRRLWAKVGTKVYNKRRYAIFLYCITISFIPIIFAIYLLLFGNQIPDRVQLLKDYINYSILINIIYIGFFAYRFFMIYMRERVTDAEDTDDDYTLEDSQ